MNASSHARASEDGHWNAERYARNARFVADFGAKLIDWLDPQPQERILDLGCGDGVLSARIAAFGAQVRGLDTSPALVDAARERGVDAVLGDGQAIGETGCYDAVFSNAALHWMGASPQAVLDGVARALVPGGRFVAEMGAQGNIAPIHAALRDECAARGLAVDAIDPWFFPADKDYIKQLEDAGFSIRKKVVFERPTPLPGDIGDWLLTLAGPFVHAFAAGAERDAFIHAVRDRLAPQLCLPDGRWVAPYVRLRFDARKPLPD